MLLKDCTVSSLLVCLFQVLSSVNSSRGILMGRTVSERGATFRPCMCRSTKTLYVAYEWCSSRQSVHKRTSWIKYLPSSLPLLECWRTSLAPFLWQLFYRPIVQSPMNSLRLVKVQGQTRFFSPQPAKYSLSLPHLVSVKLVFALFRSTPVSFIRAVQLYMREGGGGAGELGRGESYTCFQFVELLLQFDGYV